MTFLISFTTTYALDLQRATVRTEFYIPVGVSCGEYGSPSIKYHTVGGFGKVPRVRFVRMRGQSGGNCF